MAEFPPFPSGTLTVRRFDGTETRVWLGRATVSHAERLRKSWGPGLERIEALDRGWNWRAEVEAALSEPAHHLVLAVCQRDKGGRVHAMMSMTVLPRASRIRPGDDLLYVEMLAVAPWNRAGSDPREIRGLGPLLLQTAVMLSRELGLGGAFGLHSLPDPATLRFYHEKLSMRPMAIDETAEGKLVYFEADNERGEALLDPEVPAG